MIDVFPGFPHSLWTVFSSWSQNPDPYWMIEVLGFDSRRGLWIFLFTTASSRALGPTQPPIQRVPGALSQGVKRLVREADHSPPSSAEVKECVELYLHSPNTPSWRGAQLQHRDNVPLPLRLPLLMQHSFHLPQWMLCNFCSSKKSLNITCNKQELLTYQLRLRWNSEMIQIHPTIFLIIVMLFTEKENS
jgi:hypothetical protein